MKDAKKSNDVLQQQIAYYRARAGEYDEWFYRLNRYDRGEMLNQQWFDEVALVLHDVQALGHVGDALELACGTGIWTKALAQLADHVAALDASEEVLALNREKLKAANVTYQQADLFTWEPEQQYDLVFFSFWLSHVPPEQFAPFLAKVNRATKPGGRIYLIDSRPDETSTAKDNPLRKDEHIYRTRKLNDGSTYMIVKVFYEPESLSSALRAAGFAPEVRTTEHYFIFASATKEHEADAVS